MSSYELGKIHVNDEIEMARIVAQLVREGVTFEVDKQKYDTWCIVLTGGY